MSREAHGRRLVRNLALIYPSGLAVATMLGVCAIVKQCASLSVLWRMWRRAIAANRAPSFVVTGLDASSSAQLSSW
jgi:hypothetical protein